MAWSAKQHTRSFLTFSKVKGSVCLVTWRGDEYADTGNVEHCKWEWDHLNFFLFNIKTVLTERTYWDVSFSCQKFQIQHSSEYPRTWSINMDVTGKNWIIHRSFFLTIGHVENILTPQSSLQQCLRAKSKTIF